MIKTYNLLAPVVVAVMMLIAAAMLVSCTISIEKNDSKEEVTRDFKVADFKTIKSNFGAEIIFSISDTTMVKAVGSERQMERLNIKTKDGVLYINMKDAENNNGNITINNRHRAMRIYISAPVTEGVRLMGSGAFKCKDTITAKVFDAVIDGSGDIKLKAVKAEYVNARIAGSGDIDLGTVEAAQTELSVAGSGDIDAHERNVGLTKIQIAGSGDIEVDMDNCTRADVNIAGSGDIKLKGTLQELNKATVGSGNIDTRDLVIK
ncbi:MAG: head GIN domain-containing protein [Prevotella sp.]